MYSIFESVINRGGYKLSEMLERIRMYAAEGRLTMKEMDSLEKLARDKANAQDGVDIFKKVEELEQRVRALEAVAPVNPDTPLDVPEYQPGKWYYSGDKAMFNGESYACIAPDGVVCVWSPTEYPAYWEKL